MAVKPIIYQFLSGMKTPASSLYEGVQRTWDFLDNKKPLAYVYQATTQSIPTSTFTTVTFDSESKDTDNMHTTLDPSRVWIGNTLGWYRVSGGVAFAGSAAGNSRRVRLTFTATFGGTTGVIGGHGAIAPAGSGFTMCYLEPVLVQSTVFFDYIELQAYQDSGSALSTLNNSQMQSFLFVEYVGTLQ